MRQAPHRCLAAVRRAVVHDPEHAARGVVRWLAHDLIDQSLEGRDAGGCFAATEHPGAMHVQRSQVGPGATASVLVLRAHRLAGSGRQARLDTQPGLDAGLLVGGDDELVLAQRLPLPAPLVQVQDAPGLGLEVWVARKDPAAVPPGTDGVLLQPIACRWPPATSAPLDLCLGDARHRMPAQDSAGAVKYDHRIFNQSDHRISPRMIVIP